MNLFSPQQPKIILRPYQQEAVDAIYNHLRTRDDNPCCVIPTAGGKTPIMATLCRDAVLQWGGRVLILAHVKELLEQAVEKLDNMAPELHGKVGIYSAGLGRRDHRHPVIVAGIQSVYRKAPELDKFDLILIDEAHRIAPEGEGMYQTFLNDSKVINPAVRLIGLTATPYRMSTGMICAPENLLNHVCYEVGVRELIVQGYLCPIRSKAGNRKIDRSELHIRGGEFIADEVAAMMDDTILVQSACNEIVTYTTDRRACLIFAAGVEHALHIQKVLCQMGHDCGFVCGETLPFERASTLSRFKAGKLKYLVNVGVLVEGFDAPIIDCIAMMSPTMSPGRYYQRVGRGFRLHPGKTDCLILDFGGDIVTHGPVDCIKIDEKTGGNGQAPVKECPQCHALIHAGYMTCPECNYEFPPPESSKHEGQASEAAILSGEIEDTVLGIGKIEYVVHVKKVKEGEQPKPPTMRVNYYTDFYRYKSEWVCFEHQGFARRKAEQWWRQRSKMPVPATVAEAIAICQAGGIAKTTQITVRSVSGEKFDNIVSYEIGEIPEPVDVTQPSPADMTDIAAADAMVDELTDMLPVSPWAGLDEDSIPF